MKKPRTPIYGLMAEFHTPGEVVDAALKVTEAGYSRVDGFSPYPIEELSEALHFHSTPLPLMVLLGGIFGLVGGFALEYYCSVISYPINVGGRPLFSWPAFLVPAYETTILCAALAAVLGMLALNGLPEPYHPVFNVPGFALATRDRFFLCIETADLQFDMVNTRAFLESLNPTSIAEVPY